MNFDDRRAIVIALRNRASMNLFIIASAGETLHVEERGSLVIGDQHEDGFNECDGLSNRISRYLLHRDASTGKGWPHYAPGILLPVIQ